MLGQDDSDAPFPHTEGMKATAGRSEASELARLLLDEVGAATGGVQAVHRRIADRVFGAVALGVGTPALAVKAAHDAITDGVYSVIREAASATAALAEFGFAESAGDRAPSETVRGAMAIAAVDGLIGDVLESEGSPLALPVSVRVDGRAVPLTADALARALPHATNRVVVFVHGLMETEATWRFGGRRTYGERLVDDLGCTSVFVRYNTGRHISVNGRELWGLLDALVRAWPREVEQIALVGHSMGGLVARSACFYGTEKAWSRRVRHVVSLGSPHLGAPLEQAVHYASAALVAIPESKPFGTLLRRRSAGIRDLNRGAVVDEDWSGRDADDLRRAVCREVPLLDGAMHCFVSATLTRSPTHPLGRLLGDGLVLVPSASGNGRTRRIGFRAEDGMHRAPAHHLTLLNDDEVYRQLLRWLRTGPGAPRPGDDRSGSAGADRP